MLVGSLDFRIPHCAFRIPDSFPIEQLASQTGAHRARMLSSKTNEVGPRTNCELPLGLANPPSVGR